jgi:hypothetical protein
MGTAALVQVKTTPRPVASFSFRGGDVAIELTDNGYAAVKCPVCESTCRINLLTHAVVINLQTKKATTIYPGINCPNPQCGFAVVVVRGVACELGETIIREEQPLKQGEERCLECRRAFRPGRAGRASGRGRYTVVEEGEGGRRICQICSSK